MQKRKLQSIYACLLSDYGPQGWWPAKTPFEVVLGAILTQNTAWRNVEKVISEMEEKDLIDPRALESMDERELAEMIRPTGYYKQKARKIKEFLGYFKRYDYDLLKMSKEDGEKLREELLSVWGIGPETADAILLYALEKPFFVVDAYSRRVFSRMGIVPHDVGYEDLRRLFEDTLEEDVSFWQEFHALIDELAKRSCTTKPDCPNCPLGHLCPKMIISRR